MIDKAAREVFGRSETAAPDRAKVGRGAGVGLVAATTLALAALIALAAYTGWQRLGPPAAAALAASAPASAALAARQAPGRGAASTTASASAASSVAAKGALVATAPLAGAANVAAGTAPTAAASAGSGALAALDTAELKAQLATIEQDDKLAWRELVPLWGIDPGTLDPCTAAARQQVRCSKFVATMPLLKNLARPGVVGLRDANGRTVERRPGRPRPDHGDAACRRRRRWSSQTAALRQRLARRLRHALARAAGLRHGDRRGRIGPDRRPARGPDGAARRPAARPRRRRRWTRRCRQGRHAFQAAHGLGADGRAGPTTFMQLNRVTGVDEPRLAVDAARDLAPRGPRHVVHPRCPAPRRCRARARRACRACNRNSTR